MPTPRERAQLRRYALLITNQLLPTATWPRDARACAWRDRIEVLLARIQTEPLGATREDPTRFLRVVAELEEWMAREAAFVRDYPILAIPDSWMRREPSPAPARR